MNPCVMVCVGGSGSVNVWAVGKSRITTELTIYRIPKLMRVRQARRHPRKIVKAQFTPPDPTQPNSTRAAIVELGQAV
jgi:hypothetical protein